MPTIDPCIIDIDPLKLERDGTDQAGRLVPALDPTSAPVDGRSIAHGIMFAREYAKHLTYFTIDATTETLIDDGTWEPFFSGDVAVLLAAGATQDIERYRAIVQERLAYLDDIANDGNDAELTVHLSYLFGYAATLARELDRLASSLPVEIGLRGTLENLIRRKLAPALRRLIGYYNGDLASAPEPRVVLDVLPAAEPDLDILLLGASTVAFADMLTDGLSGLWLTDGSPDWATFTAAIAADPGVFGDPTGSVFERTNHIATHNLFTGALDEFLKVFARIAQESAKELETMLATYDAHAPHYALFLAFLRLYEYARDAVNGLTARHLDFYYRDVLQLAERPATPSHAHLVVELARQVASHEIAEGEAFRAGKDATGKEAYFESDRAFVANQAVVASLMKLHREGSDLYVAPIANSDDGVSAELTSSDLSWHPFYNKTFENGVLVSVDMTRATPGFAIASHYLYLREGTRTVTATLTVSGYSGAVGPKAVGAVACSFSGEKGWVDLTPTSFEALSATSLRLVVVIPGDADAIVPYSEKVHALGIDVASPMLLVRLVNTEAQTLIFSELENVVVSAIDLDVAVDRVRNLTLSNDFGPIDASKPFQPFGAQPEAGSSFLIGSPEIFSKNGLTDCSLVIAWKNIPSDIATVKYQPIEQYFLPYPFFDSYTDAVPSVGVYSLVDGVWTLTRTEEVFDGDAGVTIDLAPPANAFNKLDAPDFATDAAFNAATKIGYMRLELQSTMGHVAYREALADYLVAVAGGSTTAVKPTAPYTPEVAQIYASYAASQSIALASSDEETFDERSARFFHVTDFGHAEQHPFLKVGAPDTAIYLLPQLRHLNALDEALPAGHPVVHDGELYIGVAGIVPPQNLALLFQVADGTANPLAEKPEPHLHWSYLRDNEWIPFERTDVEDPTDELLTSGIVTLAVPRDATSQNTLLASGMHWIRVAAAERTDAVNRLVAVMAQALDATFADAGNDPLYSATPLPAGTITKLAQPDAAVKKVTQPFATFGGSGAELPTAFYARISERLRHKDRAITLWDFEHLVLEAFPGIHRVKCLNHTRYEPTDDGTGIYRERAAGHVTIVTIPDQRTTNPVDPLKPYTSLAVLEQIEAYLKERATCFATLHVRNPKFEELRVHFNVRLHDGYDETFYTKKLQEAITMFLSPWAFSDYGNPSFGGRIYQSVLINYVEEQPYVDYLTDFQLFHDVDGVLGTTNLLEVSGSTAVSILVSAPASMHLITVIDPEVDEELSEQCGCAA
jgi:hypothetical protein